MARKRIARVALAVALAFGCDVEGALSTTTPEANPFAGWSVYAQSRPAAARQAAEWRTFRPDDASMMTQLSQQPTAYWVDERGAFELGVRAHVRRATSQDTLPLLAVGHLPARECDRLDLTRFADGDAYEKWIRRVRKAIGRGPAVILLEPGIVASLECEGPGDRLASLAQAVRLLARGRVSVYLDAGNARWQAPEVVAERLRAAGIEHARGFALNVANYVTTSETIDYGRELSALVGGKPFVIDTSRNGYGSPQDGEWCNARDLAYGEPPTTQTDDPQIDAFVWAKAPGESDGPCNGGPKLGAWWPEVALEYANNTAWLRAAALLPPPPTPPLPPEPGPKDWQRAKPRERPDEPPIEDALEGEESIEAVPVVTAVPGLTSDPSDAPRDAR